MPVVISNCSNNYGPYQFPEKLIPLMINNILHEKSLPVYGDGSNIRDWLWVEDHIKAIDKVFHFGRNGETYNIGGNCEMSNLELVHLMCDLMDKKVGRPDGRSRNLIRFVQDRPGHDQRYAIDASKIKEELGWEAKLSINEGLELTIDWYLSNEKWLAEVTSGDYLNYYSKQYNK
jgi:dTDP-glucose 4,6-dehydratase